MQAKYHRSIARDNARGHFGDSHQQNTYHAPVYHYVNQTQCSQFGSKDSIKRHEEVLEPLKFDGMDDRFLTIKTAYSNTCEWLSRREEYLDWLDETKRLKHGGFLWIKGKPGTGKSTLMKHAFQNAQSVSDHDNLISFFFPARGNGLEKSTEGMYRSLLSQVMEKFPGLQHVLSTKRSRDVWPSALLSNLFCEAVHALEGNRLTCYIDALDECDDVEILDMIEIFEDLTEASTAKRIGFRVCFSSRHYPRISMATYQELILKDQAGHAGDINVYIRSKLRVQHV